ncbi:hypothetical protein HMPREF1008_00894 [Olsenella sp. oral taxon 809 str. F0356]|uniref:hypothetical protein n=1 Tax=Olsenella sp. oral taxon 809 TaxID=661086 RepID=UPI000231ED13|nr:hypothetical protein [Olsenella sp. oral taxon 809]EHF02188.1 hypothetical protein HMPREF1008_00894 [Olsenella sp. oral taxon 809 str. F0356]
MSGFDEHDYWVPEHVREYLRGLGYRLPLEDMEGHIQGWDMWMRAQGAFYDYRDTDGFGRVYQVHRRSIMPAMRVCREWGSLLLNEKTQVACEKQECTEWLESFFTKNNFMSQAQSTVVRAFGLGTGAFAIWMDLGRREVKVRHYDARIVIPLTWDAEGVTECAFCTRAYYRGKPVDQLQMHLMGKPDALLTDGLITNDNVLLTKSTYHIVTVSFDEQGNVMEPEGVIADFDTGSSFPTFAIVKPGITNTRVDMSPYGQSVFADAVDAIQSVDLAFDALINEVDVSKMRVFLSDVLFDHDRDGGKNTPIPFGKGDCTVFRKVMSTEDTITEFAPALRTEAQAEAFRIALQVLGDLCGFGLTYFDFDNTGYVKTATEVSSDNSALMRNIRRHENGLEASLAGISHAVMSCARTLGDQVPDEGDITVSFDDSIVTDTAAEKAQDMAEVGVTMAAWEYRYKWYGEDEKTAKSRARGLQKRNSANAKVSSSQGA